MASTRAGRAAPISWKEGRRRRAWELHQQGWAQATIAKALGVTPGAVSQWLAAARDRGVDALRPQSRRGQGARLTDAQLARVPALLGRGAEAFGFLGDVWTCGRIAAVLERELGVAYHPDHVRRLVHRLGWTYQKPVPVASQRDDEAVAAWTTETWPALKKRPTARAARSSSSTNRPST